MNKLFLAGVSLALLGLGYAYAQTVTNLIASPTGSEIVRAEALGPGFASVRLGQMRDAIGYQVTVPLTGFSLQLNNFSSAVSINPAGTLATGTVVTPTAPVDGQRMQIFTTQTITAFTLSPTAGQTIGGTAVTTLAANANVEYVYQASSTTWFRIQ